MNPHYSAYAALGNRPGRTASALAARPFVGASQRAEPTTAGGEPAARAGHDQRRPSVQLSRSLWYGVRGWRVGFVRLVQERRAGCDQGV